MIIHCFLAQIITSVKLGSRWHWYGTRDRGAVFFLVVLPGTICLVLKHEPDIRLFASRSSWATAAEVYDAWRECEVIIGKRPRSGHNTSRWWRGWW